VTLTHALTHFFPSGHFDHLEATLANSALSSSGQNVHLRKKRRRIISKTEGYGFK
jgi:hypothetical protein